MVGQSFKLIVAALALTVPLASGELPAPSRSQPSNESTPWPHRLGQAQMSPEFGNVRRALEALTPEQRQRFIDNLKRWANLSPEEKKALADRDVMRRKKIAEEIDRTIRETGLTLEGERRALFAKRYGEERRKLEEQLRKEMEEKRQPRLQELVARLKEEFSHPAAVPVPP